MSDIPEDLIVQRSYAVCTGRAKAGEKKVVYLILLNKFKLRDLRFMSSQTLRGVMCNYITGCYPIFVSERTTSRKEMRGGQTTTKRSILLSVSHWPELAIEQKGRMTCKNTR